MSFTEINILEYAIVVDKKYDWQGENIVFKIY